MGWAQGTAAVLLPVVAVAGVLLGFVADRWWITRVRSTPTPRSRDVVGRPLRLGAPGPDDGSAGMRQAWETERARLVADRDAAVEEAREVAERAIRAENEVEDLAARLTTADRRVRTARTAIHDITRRVESLAAMRAAGEGEGRRPTVEREAPDDGTRRAELTIGHLEAETVRLRRRLADRAIELDRIRNSPETRALHDPRLHRALDEVVDVWGERTSTAEAH